MLEELLMPQDQQGPRRSLAHKVAGISPYVRKSRELASRSRPYRQRKPKSPYKVLFLGDSTIVGVGGRPEESIAGRFAQKHPEAHIENYAVSGARAEDVLKQLERAKGRYNLTLINVGGNDLIALTPLERLRKQISMILEQATGKSDKVLLGIGGKIELVPLIPWPLTRLLSRKQTRLSALYQELTNEKGALYINYFGDEELNSHFAREPDRFFSTDRFHPSGEGYRVAYERLQKVLEEHQL